MSSLMISTLNGEDLILGPELMNTLDLNYTVGNPDEDTSPVWDSMRLQGPIRYFCVLLLLMWLLLWF